MDDTLTHIFHNLPTSGFRPFWPCASKQSLNRTPLIPNWNLVKRLSRNHWLRRSTLLMKVEAGNFSPRMCGVYCLSNCHDRSLYLLHWVQIICYQKLFLSLCFYMYTDFTVCTVYTCSTNTSWCTDQTIHWTLPVVLIHSLDGCPKKIRQWIQKKTLSISRTSWIPHLHTKFNPILRQAFFEQAEKKRVGAATKHDGKQRKKKRRPTDTLQMSIRTFCPLFPALLRLCFDCLPAVSQSLQCYPTDFASSGQMKLF